MFDYLRYYIVSLMVIIGIAGFVVGGYWMFAGIGTYVALFVLALRHLGTARTGAYFSTAPFLGSVAAVLLLGDSVTLQLIVAGLLVKLVCFVHLVGLV